MPEAPVAQPASGEQVPCAPVSGPAVTPKPITWPLTGAQQRVIAEVLADLSRPKGMARLLQGVVVKHSLMKQSLIPINKSGGAGAEGFLDVKASKGKERIRLYVGHMRR